MQLGLIIATLAVGGLVALTSAFFGMVMPRSVDRAGDGRREDSIHH